MALNKIYYGWAVCTACTMLVFITMGSVSNGFSIFLPYIIENCGLTHAQGSSLITIRCFVAFFAMLGISYYYKLFSLRTGTVIAALFAVLAFFIYGTAKTYFQFAVGAAITGLSYGVGSMVPVSLLMNRWFIDHRALALGICSTGSGIATIVLPGVITTLIERFDMSTAFKLLAVFLGFMALIIFLILRDSPQDKGLKPLGWEKASKKAVFAKEIDKVKGKEEILSKRLWIYLGISALCMGALANPGFSHIAVLFTEEGFSSSKVALFISIEGATLIAGKVLCGQIADEIGGFKTTVIFGSILFIGNALCCLAFLKSTLIAALNMLILGLGYPLATIGPSIWANDFTKDGKFPVVLKRLQVIYAGGALLFASIPGILADISGSYISSYVMFAGIQMLVIILMTLAYRGKKYEI